MKFLEKIIEHKKSEVADRKAETPVSVLEKSLLFETRTISLKEHICCSSTTGIIAEYKRLSPSLGPINLQSEVKEVTQGYVRAGASALSVLTDQAFFGGSNADLKEARKYNLIPILRKDFVVDPYQIYEARSIGADAVLLIAECLTAAQVGEYTELAHTIGLEVLLELHSADQLEKIDPNVDLVGINNRDLRTFKTDLQTSFELRNRIPDSFCCISESGISTASDIKSLQEAGFSGFLIGTRFMQTKDPAAACEAFIQSIDEPTKAAMQ